MATGSAEIEPALGALPRRLGRYTLLKRIAKGGMGEVLLAATSGIEGAERPVIVKMIREEHRADASFRARFLDEARVQAQLAHGGVAAILDATTDDATQEPYVVVEHVDGKNLGDVRSRALASGARLDWAESVSIAQLVAEALAHVHDRRDPAGQPLSIVHRDLSPQNVMIAFTGEAKLIDFGTARGQNRRCHTVAGVVFAKPGYVAPEVANGDSGDFRVDLYALGVMLWELCAGRRFLDGEASDHLAAVAAGQRDLPPVAEQVGAPARLDAVLAKLTAHDRAQRYESSRDAARELAALLADAPSLAGGERGVRARVAALLAKLFPGDSSRFRREFHRLVEDARRKLASAPPPASAAPASASPAEPAAASPAQEAAPLDPPAPADAGAPEPADRLPGTRWRLLRELGRGACSVVWEAEHEDLGTRAAIKVHPGGSAGKSRFRIESRALARVGAPAVPALREAGVARDGRPFTALELLDGETLASWAAARAPLAEDEALRVVDKLLAALAAVHDAGLVHRDLKPENVLCLRDGSVRVIDLGVARDLSPDAEEDPPSGGALALHGTPAYMAPEQASGVADERSDLYAVGCILYELIAGSLPFQAESDVGALAAKAKGSPEPLRERIAPRVVSRDVDDLVLRALARHPSVRFASARAMRDAVLAVLDAPAKGRARRRRWGVAALVTAMLAGVGILAAPRLPGAEALIARLTGEAHTEARAEVAPERGLLALAPPEEVLPVDPLAALPAEIAAEERALRALEDAALEDAALEDAALGAVADEVAASEPAPGEALVDAPEAEEAAAPPPKKKRRRREAASGSERRERKGDRARAADPKKGGAKGAPPKKPAGKGSKEKSRSKKRGKGADPAAAG